MKNPEYALIVAGGKGTRMGSALPKQFIAIDGLPILMHTINAFYAYSSTIQVILVLPQEDFSTWTSLCERHHFNRPVVLQQGGATRFQSVKRGLAKIEGDGLVAIHDGVRPLVSATVIDQSFRIAEKENSAVAAVNLKESIREVQQGGTKALDRTKFKLIQTPQTFKVALIKRAYEMEEDLQLTDDASVAERGGHSITLFEGSYDNIKVTTPEDLVFAEAYLQSQKTAKPA
ncbi:2-C-methyl-D-erythritol 4-phosphate cytidylyltransferase [Pseudochryseolinea flava]|uniref:2-C-methyl-D-erythritol 4-phosphate cytidylyltransferase n=1 Tax=Pseudochryseolinea flava TaxID=2059302 RepID=A0A364XX04_9BACT|nr:2-C-methyl-D-erythritol 4-phosphate cytidylyltransferase [Pseudochryseolinea flava]RAV98292.1 2-C-methyl-D-erythritol 4-phosphate cytidylyltransferase [Pseudochryseolinea flava]